MWAIIPVKRLDDAKLRLAGVLTPAQRRQLSLCMLEDILDTLGRAALVSGVTVVSCDPDVMRLALGQGADVLDTGTDGGYAADVLKGIGHHGARAVDKMLIIPADVPALEQQDLVDLERGHKEGVTLCPAANDGGTNGLVFTPPLAMALRYGEDSFNAFRREVERRQLPLRVARPAGLARDVDRPEDLFALLQQGRENRTWRYLDSLKGASKN